MAHSNCVRLLFSLQASLAIAIALQTTHLTIATRENGWGNAPISEKQNEVAMLEDLAGAVPTNENCSCAVSAEKRQDERFNGPLSGTMRYTGHDSEVEVRNLSARGAMADGIFDVAVGQYVSLRIGRGSWIRAKVAWAIAPRCGLEFRSPVDPAAVHDSNWVA